MGKVTFLLFHVLYAQRCRTLCTLFKLSDLITENPHYIISSPFQMKHVFKSLCSQLATPQQNQLLYNGCSPRSLCSKHVDVCGYKICSNSVNITRCVLSTCSFALSVFINKCHVLENTEILILKTKALGEQDQFSCLPLIYGVSSRDSDSCVEECQE